GIQDEGRVVARVVVAQARRPVVDAPVRQGGGMKGVDHRGVPSLEGEMLSPRQFATGGDAVGRGDEELVGPEEILAFAADGYAEHPENRLVEPEAGRQVVHHELEWVDQAAAMEFVGFHGTSGNGSIQNRTPPALGLRRRGGSGRMKLLACQLSGWTEPRIQFGGNRRSWSTEWGSAGLCRPGAARFRRRGDPALHPGTNLPPARGGRRHPGRQRPGARHGAPPRRDALPRTGVRPGAEARRLRSRYRSAHVAGARPAVAPP